MTEPTLKPTNPATLVVAALVAAAAGWWLISGQYGHMAALPWLPAVTLIVLAVVEFVLAYQTWTRIHRKPGKSFVQPLTYARYVVLAKASSLTGAIFAGLGIAFTLWLAIDRRGLPAVDRDLPVAVLTLVGSLALIGAALLLERACRIPKNPDDEDKTDSTPDLL